MSQLLVPPQATAVAAQPSLGQEMADAIVGNIENDIAFSIHRRAAHRAQARLEQLKVDWAVMMAKLKESYDPAYAAFARLYVGGCREEVVATFLAVSRQTAATPEGAAIVRQQVDRLIGGLLGDLDQLDAEHARKEEVPAPVPLDEPRKRKQRP